MCKQELKKGVPEVDTSELAAATASNVKDAEIRGVANWLCNARKGLPLDLEAPSSQIAIAIVFIVIAPANLCLLSKSIRITHRM